MAVHYNMGLETNTKEQAECIESIFKDLTIELSNGEIAKIISAYRKVESKYAIYISAEGMHMGHSDSNDNLIGKKILIEFENKLIQIIKDKKYIEFNFALFQCEIYDDFINNLFLKELLDCYGGDKNFFERRYSGLIISNNIADLYGLKEKLEIFSNNYKWVDNRNKRYLRI